MLEKMDAFFTARLDGYDAHMMADIEGARDFYPYTASLLPDWSGAKVLDLGCGTGLELEAYFQRNGGAAVTGIDLSASMLERLREKFPDRDISLIHGSYFDVPLGRAGLTLRYLWNLSIIFRLGRRKSCTTGCILR